MKAKFVDVDGHIMEPSNLWMEYLEHEYKDRALRIERDEKGLEYLSVEGKWSWWLSGGTLGAVGAIGQDVKPFLTPGKVSYEDAVLPGARYPDERVKVMDDEGIDMTFIYPSLGLNWEHECKDPKLAAAYARAYNNWVLDFCRPHPDRLIPVAHIPTLDIQEGVKELERTLKLGAKAAMLVSLSPTKQPYGTPYFDPLWAVAQEAEMPITIHPASGSLETPAHYYPRPEDNTTWWSFVMGGEDVKMNFTSLFNSGTFDRFPRLKVVVLESGIGWLVYWIDRMEEKFDVNGFTTGMKLRPQEYFQRQCWAAMDPDERLVKYSIDVLGAEKFLWAFDYPHSDSVVNPVGELKENLAPLPEEAQRKVFGENAIELYRLAA